MTKLHCSIVVFAYNSSGISVTFNTANIITIYNFASLAHIAGYAAGVTVASGYIPCIITILNGARSAVASARSCNASDICLPAVISCPGDIAGIETVFNDAIGASNNTADGISPSGDDAGIVTAFQRRLAMTRHSSNRVASACDIARVIAVLHGSISIARNATNIRFTIYKAFVVTIFYNALTISSNDASNVFFG